LPFDEVLGPRRFFIWSKENELYRTFFRTEFAGHWTEKDVHEFINLKTIYEIHLQHGQDEIAHSFCLHVLERSENFKAAKYSKIALNNMKVLCLLGKSSNQRSQIQELANYFNFKLERVRSRTDAPSSNESESRKKFREYLKATILAFNPTLARSIKI
jgi:hypothetical protein